MEEPSEVTDWGEVIRFSETPAVTYIHTQGRAEAHGKTRLEADRTGYRGCRKGDHQHPWHRTWGADFMRSSLKGRKGKTASEIEKGHNTFSISSK